MNNTSKPKPDSAAFAEARRQILTEWRGFDAAPLEKALQSSARSLASVLPQVLSRFGHDRRRLEAEILRVWNHLLDPLIVAHAHPTGIHKGTLFVAVDSNVWLSEIVRYRRKEILELLRHSFGRELIQRISFRVG